LPLYEEADFERESGTEGSPDQAWRPLFFRDYARVLHSASFRRLQGKTQVFPGHESDFFRNRLTHSLEVSQIAEGIAARLNYEHPSLKDARPDQKLDGRLCAVAGMIHDLGHPPFGHNGERALDDAMRQHGGFEGNAQTLRIVSRLEKKTQGSDGQPLGLDLTFRVLASVLKYDRQIPRSRRPSQKLVKGYYLSEKSLVEKIRTSVGRGKLTPKQQLKTVECAIMDLADDIAYSTYDLEDSLKAGFLSPSGILASSDTLLDQVAAKVSSELKRDPAMSRADVLRVFAEIFSGADTRETPEDTTETFIETFRAYRDLASSGYLRTALSSQLVNEAVMSVTLDYNEQCPSLSKVSLSKKIVERVEVLKQYVFIATIYSSRVKLPEYRGYEIVSGIFEALSGERGNLLMPEDVRSQHEAAGDHDTQMRIICDFVAGMTDRYAMEFYGRLHSDSAQSMFKPV